MQRILCLVFLLPSSLAAQSIYWKQDHIYASPGGSRIAMAMPVPTDQVAPVTPANLAYSNLTSSSVQLSWTATTDNGGAGLAGYKVYRGNVPVGTVATTTFTDSHLQAGTAYAYTVRAFDNDQNHSSPSAAVNFTSPSVDDTAPSTPSGLTATIDNGVVLEWDATFDLGGSGLAGYKIYRDTDLIATLPDPIVTYTDQTVLGELYIDYTYTVTAYDNASNESLPGTGAEIAYPGLHIGLVSFWELEESSGTRVDAHGSNDLLDNNSVGQAAGQFGNAGQFVSANGESLTIAHNSSIGAGDIDLTFAGWVYLDSKTVGTGNMLGTGAWASPMFGYRISYVQSLDRMQFVVSGNGTSVTNVEADTFGAPSLDTWYFVVAYHDADNNEFGISINNGVFDTKAHSGGVFDGWSNFAIGSAGVGGVNWDGRIDQVGYWKRVLSPAEIEFLFNNGSGRSYSGF